MRKVVEEKKEEKKVFELEEAFVLWENTSKSNDNMKYLTGKTSSASESMKLVAFYNTNKKNPKEPDIRVYAEGETTKEIASLWDTITKNEKRILTGSTTEKERLVCFYRKDDNTKYPYIRAYYQKDEQ